MRPRRARHRRHIVSVRGDVLAPHCERVSLRFPGGWSVALLAVRALIRAPFSGFGNAPSVSRPVNYRNERATRRGPDTFPPVVDGARDGNYGVPVVHKPHWKWLIIAYFFFGGIAGAAYSLAAVADVVDARGNRPVVRAGRYISFAAFLPCPALLILDLGRPERFYMMLRVLKLRSPMSLGTWALTLFGAFSAFSASAQAADDGLLPRRFSQHAPSPRVAKAVGLAGSPVALFLASYTGILLAATAVPIWTKRALLLGPLFLASGVSTAASAIALVLHHDDSPGAVRRLASLENSAALVELGLLAAWARGLGPTARPLAAGGTSRVVTCGVVDVGLVTPIVLRSLALGVGSEPCNSKFMGYVASVSALLGGLALRYAVVIAGRASADDPRATFAETSTSSHSTTSAGAHVTGR